MITRALVVCALVAAVAGFGIGRFTADQRAGSVTPAELQRELGNLRHELLVSTSPRVLGGTAGPLPATPERASPPGELVAAASPPQPVAQPPRADPQNAESYQRAQSLVDDAMRRGMWTVDDMRAFRSSTAALDGDQRQVLIGKLIVELNSGRIRKFAGPGLPF